MHDEPRRECCEVDCFAYEDERGRPGEGEEFKKLITSSTACRHRICLTSLKRVKAEAQGTGYDSFPADLSTMLYISPTSEPTQSFLSHFTL